MKSGHQLSFSFISRCSAPPIATFLRDFVNPFGEWSALLTPSCASDDARNSKHERLHRCRLVHQGGSCRLDPFPSCRLNSKPPLSADVVGSHLFTRTLRCSAGSATYVPTNKSLKSLRTVAIAPLKSRHASRNRERIREKLRLHRECRETCADPELRYACEPRFTVALQIRTRRQARGSLPLSTSNAVPPRISEN